MLGLALAGGLLLTSTVVSAGCPNPCEMAVSEAKVEPPLSCSRLEVRAQDCDCSVWFSIHNECTQSIDASMFSWDRCFPTTGTCTSIQPDDEGILEPRLTAVGHRDFSFVVTDAEGPHTITFASDVKSFDDTSCAVGARGTSGRPLWFAVLGLFALGLVGRLAAGRRR